ncbi:MAG: hypothetical protein CMI31_04410 [Opitutae bacterium]|nr:hypothetical protein [Opitutae bacterium]|tara:strand:+ start:5663 stop:6391 length:729 start_codon:yes stop_codon:yes gene_type:complete
MTARFNEQAHEYHDQAMIQKDLASWTAEWLESEISGLEGIEFGAGTGHFTQLLVSKNLTLRAIDLSPRMIALGSALVPEAQWELGNAWVPADSYNADRIFSSALLQWCKDPLETLLRWRSCLRTGGRLLCGMYVRETLPELTQVLPGSAPFHWHTPEEWSNFFEEAGFTIIRAESHKKTYHFPNAIELLRYLHRIGSVRVGRFSANVLRSAVRNYDTAYAGQKDISSTWTFFRIECLSGNSL